MTPNQLRNLLNFTILFSGVDSNCRLEASSPDYIWEKYCRMIGVNPKVNPSYGWQISKLDADMDCYFTKLDWYVRWGWEYHLALNGNKHPLSPEHDQVINYLSVISRKSWSQLVPSEIVEEFTKHIGDPNLI